MVTISAKPQSSDSLGKTLAAVALIFTVLLVVPLRPIMPMAGLDPSWTYALNEAVAGHLVFGRDIVFSFGPLGSAYTRFYHPATDGLVICAAALLAVGLWSGFALLAFPRRLFVLVLLPFVIAAAELRDALFMAPPLLLTIAAFRLSLPEESEHHLPLTASIRILFGLLACAVGILPLVKGSFAGIAIVEAAASVVLLLLARRSGLAVVLILFVVLALCGSWAASGQPIDALPMFFITQTPIVSGYSEAMSLPGPFRAVVYWAVAAVAAVLFFFVGATRRHGLRGWIVLFGLGVYLFVTFKAGFVRQDGHERISGIALVTLALAGGSILRGRPALMFALIALIGWIGIERSTVNLGIGDIAQRIRTAFNSSVEGIALRRAQPDPLPKMFAEAKAAIRSAFPLPPVSGTADVYPTELAALFANGIAWSGRPVPQSYSVYRPQLDKMNADHLNGPKAPQHVFFAVAPIDGRLPSLEDAGSWPLLLADYSIAGETSHFLHMVRSSETGTPVPRPLRTAAARLNESIDVPAADGLIWAQIDMQPTTSGRLILAAFKLPQVTIELTLENGQVIEHRYVPEMGHRGFLISPYVGSTQDFLMLAAGVADAARVRRMRVWTSEIGLWDTNIQVAFSSLSIPQQSAARQWALEQPQTAPAFLAEPTDAGATCSLDMVNSAPVASHQGDFVVGHKVAALSGWAAPSAQQGMGPDENWIVLTAVDGSRSYYKARSEERPDVKKAFNQPMMKEPGFMAHLDISTLSGRQEVTIYTIHDGKAQSCGITRTLSLD